jgi:hypothetical protein
VDGVTLSNATLVFLKTNFRKLFYLVSDEEARELSVLDALNYFKAKPEELKVERISQHHDHVDKALKKFETTKTEEIHEQESNHQQRTNLGAQVAIATNLLNNVLGFVDDSETRLKIIQLKSLAERGTITYIAKRLQRIQKELQRTNGKVRMTIHDALPQVIDMANKYNAYYREAQKAEEETGAVIILSESFK